MCLWNGVFFMNAELLAVGTELLLGEILNTDSKFLAEELSVSVSYTHLNITAVAFEKSGVAMDK